MVPRVLKQVGEQILDPSRDRFVSVMHVQSDNMTRAAICQKKAMHSTDCTRGRYLEISSSRLGSFYLLIAIPSMMVHGKHEICPLKGLK